MAYRGNPGEGPKALTAVDAAVVFALSRQLRARTVSLLRGLGLP
jgi:hypothetical protein